MNKVKRFIGNKIVKNSAWIMAGRIIHTLLSFLIGLITARYLGPSNYGLIGYAGAYTTFFTAVCTLGINSIIVKNFYDYPDEEGKALGTTIVLRIITGIMSVSVISGIVFVVDKGDMLSLAVVALYSLSLVFQAFDIFHQWFQSRMMSKYYVFATLISFVTISLFKIYLLATEKSVIWFALSNAVDYALIAGLLYMFFKICKGPHISFSWEKGKKLLKSSKSYILVGLMSAIYAFTDRFMLKQFIGEAEVGYYSIAFTVSAMGAFVLSAMIESISPSVMQYHNEDKTKYITTNKILYALVFYFSVLMSVVVFFIAPLFIKIVYGEAYSASVDILRVAVWYVAFSYLGVARNVWIVCEKKQRYIKYIYMGSAILNVLINALLIPFFGAVGAAFASLITQISTIFVFPLFFKELRPNVKLMVEAIMLKGVLPFKKGGK